MTDQGIVISGAREHNLKNINLTLPRNKTIVVTGLSGSGKSSLAFNTIYAEGQRRYVESFSTYARNFLEQFKKPDIDSISGLSPSIAIEQKALSFSAKSTVGTVTEVYEYLRLLYARVGIPKCPQHKISVEGQSIDTIINNVLSLKRGERFRILAPIIRGKRGPLMKRIPYLKMLGYVRGYINGNLMELEAFAKKTPKPKINSMDIIIDQVVIEPPAHKRIKKSIQSALELSDGYLKVMSFNDSKKQQLFSLSSACPSCGFSFEALEPAHFSFNHIKGVCENCSGLGYLMGKILQDDDEDMIENDNQYPVCPSCQGGRLNEMSRNVFINDKSIVDLSQMSLNELKHFLNHDLYLSHRSHQIVDKVLIDIKDKIKILCDLGVGYLNLLRSASSLSGGEYQRVRLATQLGSSLIGVTYVLDEPSIGLHPRDHNKLLNSLEQLKNRGNTILVVEHDEDTILRSDYVVDLGPGAGAYGGEVVVAGPPSQIRKASNSLTGQYLKKKKVAYQNKERSYKKAKHWIKIRGASGNNLKNIDVDIPLGLFVAVTGVSGSGKSTLIMDTLFCYLHNHFHISEYMVKPYQKILGANALDNVIHINQKPIGRTPRSNPSTYVGLLSPIRDLFAQLPEARRRGYKPGRFSFNVKGGRCENCMGAGQVKVEMHFMADLFMQCEVCMGQRYNSETLDIKYRDKNISDVLNMSVLQAKEFFKNHIKIQKKLETLSRVGLDYIHLGQSSTTLSGGEAQRIKLSKELSKTGRRKVLYILDEPTTGLHFEDIRKLIHLMQELVDKGHSIVVIEHNLDVVRSSDYVIDLGPDGGKDGGQLVARGFPDKLELLGPSATHDCLNAQQKRKPPSKAKTLKKSTRLTRTNRRFKEAVERL